MYHHPSFQASLIDAFSLKKSHKGRNQSGIRATNSTRRSRLSCCLHTSIIVPASSRSASKKVQGLFVHPHQSCHFTPLDFIYTGQVVLYVSCGRDPAWLGWGLPILMRREPLARVQIPAAAPQQL